MVAAPVYDDWQLLAAEFAAKEIDPIAARCDRLEETPRAVVKALGRAGLLGASLPTQYGGGGCDPLSLGEIHCAIARSSASVHGFLNVHQMAAQTLLRWGTRALCDAWLPRLASGEALAAFAITEPGVGSDIARVETRADETSSGFTLSGHKKWITSGQVADVFVMLAASRHGPVAVLLEANDPGLEIVPMSGLLGCRGYMLAELHLKGCRVPAQHVLGRPGFGAAPVIASGLDQGRFGLAWACTGIAEACLDCCSTRIRSQGDDVLRKRQLVAQMLTRMVTRVDAMRLLCERAAALRGAKDALSIEKTFVAKYYASTALSDVTSDAIQILGAVGCTSVSPIERYFRDAKIMEIIEGTTQIHELAIADLVCRRTALRPH